MNEVILTGRLGKNWERIDKTSMFLANSIAVDRFSKNDGKQTDWFNIKVFNEHIMDNLEKYSGKGTQVLIQGHLSLYKQDGQEYPVITLIADRVEWFNAGSKETSENTSEVANNDDYDHGNLFDMEIPEKKEDKDIFKDDDSILWD